MNEHKLTLADDPSAEQIDGEEMIPVSDFQAGTEPFTIKTVDDRKRAMKWLAKVEKKRLWLKSERDRFEAWYAAEDADITEKGAYMRAVVEQWATVNRDSMVRLGTKTIKIPEGEISWRKTGGRLVVTDKDALAAWCVEEGPLLALYRVKTEPEMARVQNVFKATGVIPPGCEYSPEVEEIRISPSQPLLPKET